MHNLPHQISSFIGRERELAEVQRLLTTARLVTLTGMGGYGKTRLALQVAATLMDHYPDGVWLVELAAVTDPALVPQTIAAVLDVVEQVCCSPIETLIDFFGDKQLLLILDNCEHVIEPSAQTAEALLRACPQLVILATSREALTIAGEFIFPVQPFALPECDTPPSLDEMWQSDAVRLFMDRAMAVQPHFTLTDQNARAIAEICQQLDGLPLAIELAAARIPTLTAEQIATRLASHNRFDLLTTGSRTAAPRHQTLRGVVDWSYELLSAKEQTLFRRLAVFAGGWSIEAAEAVCADEDGASLRATEVLDLLTLLVNKSLVLVEDRSGLARYRMLETIRQYAHEKLRDSGEFALRRDRHLYHFCLIAEETEAKLHGPDQVAWFNRPETDFANLRAAMEWSLEDGPDANRRAEIGLRLTAAANWFWFLRDHRHEAEVWLDRMLKKNSAPSDAARIYRARVLCGAGFLAIWKHEQARATALSEEALAIARDMHDDDGIGSALYNLALVANSQEDYARCARLAEESSALFRTATDTANLIWSLNAGGDAALRQKDYARAGVLYHEALDLARAEGDVNSVAWLLPDVAQVYEFQGDYDRARPLLEESLDLFRALKNRSGLPYTLANLGQVALHQGDLEHATAWCEESARLFRELGYTESIHWPLDLLGITACYQGHYEQAVTYYREALTSNKRFRYRQGTAENLAGLGAIATCLGQFEVAVKLFGAAEALLDAIGTDLGPADLEQYRQAAAAAKAQLDETAYAQAWAVGRALTWEQAIDFAFTLDMSAPVAPSATLQFSPHSEAQPDWGGLTRRERQIAALVAQGKSNRDIAAELVLSERTIENHVGNILAKLEFNSRTQIAAWVVEKGLLESNGR